MKIAPLILLAGAALIPLSLTASQSTASSKDALSTKDEAALHNLQVAVDVPASMRPWVDDDVAEAFADRVGEALDRQGFKGDTAYVDEFSEPDSMEPLLKINLVEWRTNHIGSVDCTFSASLETSKGTENLGLFTGSSMLLGFPRRDWFARREKFDDAARRALSDLLKRMEETKLLAS